MKKFTLTLHVRNKIHFFQITKEENILSILEREGIKISSPCGGYGSCGKCCIHYLSPPPEPTPAEIKNLTDDELDKGIRLACQHTISKNTDLKSVNDKQANNLQILSKGLVPEHRLEPDIITKPEYGQQSGLAIDIGTTTLVISLFDLKTGRRLGLATARNPQERFGADIISRATAATESPENLKTLQVLLIQKLNKLIKTLTGKPETIVHTVIAGNTVMSHLFLGISIDTLVTAPYIAPFTEMKSLDGNSSGLCVHPQGKVTILPGIGSFIGGDISADLLVSQVVLPEHSRYLLMDLGTNCEIVLMTPNFAVAASAPAGPVMEGSGIAFGMQAEPGALSDLVYDKNNEFQLVTIGNRKVRGICGSGLIHTIHTLGKMNVISPDGRFNTGTPYADRKNGFRIDKRIRLTPKDIRAYQMAKSAITSTWKLLLQDSGMTCDDLDYLVIAGGFGHYIRPEAGIELGLFPKMQPDAFLYLGNGSLTGCELVLRNKKFIPDIISLAEKTQHSEMAGREDFQETYVGNMGVMSAEC
ncbi:MAG TPA: DUF4445 domain-containing protein [Candidatus Marinimicrobia bacterium]|nr:DUF4445 domain-containing protein [Candidatus Neomarinimicrobiota bacterium]